MVARGELRAGAHSADASPDGRHVAVIGDTGLQMLDLQTGVVSSLADKNTSRTAWTWHARYAPDGSTVVTADSVGVSLWNGKTGALLGTVAPAGTTSSPVFGPDSQTILIPSWDGAVYRWDTSLRHGVEFACSVAGRDFTRTEWRQIVGDRPFEPTCPQT